MSEAPLGTPESGPSCRTKRADKSVGAAGRSGNPPFGQSLAPETSGYLTRLRELMQLGKLRPTTHWCSLPGQERGPGFFRSLALMAARGADATRVTSLESLVLLSEPGRAKSQEVQSMKAGIAKSKRKQPDTPKVDWKALEVRHPDAAGIDIGGKEHWVAISPERDEQPVRCFDCFTSDLEQMADWLAARGVRSVVDAGVGDSAAARDGGLPGECPAHQESARPQERYCGMPVAAEAAHLRL